MPPGFFFLTACFQAELPYLYSKRTGEGYPVQYPEPGRNHILSVHQPFFIIAAGMRIYPIEMRRTLTISVFFVMLVQWIAAQNIQLHYDLGKARNGIDREPGFLTSTVELFRPDSSGSTFLFVDMDYNGNHGVSRGYLELARNISFHGSPVQLRMEYNGGLLLSDTTRGISIGNAWLIGPNLPFRVQNVRFNTYLTYKYFPRDSHQVQWTLGWNYRSPRNVVLLSGFLDLWTADDPGNGRKLVLLSEPQLWLHVWSAFYLGSELEISRNFYPWMQGMRFFPTLGIKAVLKS